LVSGNIDKLSLAAGGQRSATDPRLDLSGVEDPLRGVAAPLLSIFVITALATRARLSREL
jgi:hypothetical protein